MSKTWKIVIGVIVVVVVLFGLGALRWSSRVYWGSGGERGWSLGASAYQMFGWDPADYMADFNRGPLAYRGPGAYPEGGSAQVEVRLIDDDEDGVPDRGVIDLPAKGTFGRDFGPGRGAHFGRNFGPGYTHFGPGGGPFFFVGGLLRLAFLVLVIGLAIFFYRRWRAKRSTAPTTNAQSDS